MMQFVSTNLFCLGSLGRASCTVRCRSDLHSNEVCFVLRGTLLVFHGVFTFSVLVCWAVKLSRCSLIVSPDRTHLVQVHLFVCF